MKISIIGAGYVGLVTGVCFADKGHEVICVDVDSEKVDKINKGIAPIHEEDLSEMLKRNKERLTATTDYKVALSQSNITFICVGTPSRTDGSIDLSYVKEATRIIGQFIDKWHLIVVKSTVVPGTTRNIIIPLLEKVSGKKEGKDFSVAMNPEFLREGKAIHDFQYPDRIVIGTLDKKSSDLLQKIYTGIDAPLVNVSPTVAEMIKYASNALLATKISFTNEIGNVCKKLDIDVYDVMNAVGMDHRISPHFLQAGAGFGGSCFPKDVAALVSHGCTKGLDMFLLNAVMKVNDNQPLIMLEILRKHVSTIKGQKIAVLGLAFKPGTDDIRESRSIPLIRELLHKEARVAAFDPIASSNMEKVFPHIDYPSSVPEALKDAMGCLILTGWKEFADIDFSPMKKPVVIDGRHIIKTQKDIIYEGLCW